MEACSYCTALSPQELPVPQAYRRDKNGFVVGFYEWPLDNDPHNIVRIEVHETSSGGLVSTAGTGTPDGARRCARSSPANPAPRAVPTAPLSVSTVQTTSEPSRFTTR